jgi:chemotaxis-related protein WspD
MSTSLPLAVAVNDCWNRIGIGGDRSCPELPAHVHCRSCPVFAMAARTFFDRPAPEGYLAQWTRQLAQEKEAVEEDFLTVLLFRLHAEWLALTAKTLAEVTHPRPVHRIPHRSNEAFVGLLNVRGQLLLCVSLHGLLGVDPADQPPPAGDETISGRKVYQRLVIIGSKAERWAFPADEVRGVERVARSQLRPVPSTLARFATSYSRSVFTWNDCSVGLLDEQRVISALRSLGK